MRRLRTAGIRLFVRAFFMLVLALTCCRCGDRQQGAATQSRQAVAPEYLNHSDSARYVGMQVCRGCHADIYNTFIRTGMGQSIARATHTKSAADFSRATIYDRFSDYHYQAYWRGDSMYMKEFRLAPNGLRDTTFSRTEQVNYIIGSGQHTNSHIHNFNGYLHQMPMTYYTQDGKWDLPPGFENGENSRFTRRIGLECMSCHNAYPSFVMGSENKFTHVPEGIDCERCHGPGSLHVSARMTGERVDTGKEKDLTIVNPAKLPIERQFDVCQRCHLQGNAVLKSGRSFYDFRPGMTLNKFITVFMPRYEGADDEFIMASHAERLKMSQCFIVSARRAEGTKRLKPYKDAMTCVTCHNPHVSVRETGSEVFNNACRRCHAATSQSLSAAHEAIRDWKNCVGCHMPRSGSIDIPHVTVHDHYIRKPVTSAQKKSIRKFLGLYAVNDRNPPALTRVMGYLSQFERFKRDPVFLDSAMAILTPLGENDSTVHAWLQLFFLRDDYHAITSLAARLGAQRLRTAVFISRSYDNRDAWSCYRLGEAYMQQKMVREAIGWYTSAVNLAPFNPDFRNKLGTSLSAGGSAAEAEKQFEMLVREHPYYVSGYSNLGFMRLSQGQPAEAARLFNLGMSLDADNVPLLLNLASYQLFSGDKSAARKTLAHILLRDPHNVKAKQALASLGK